MPFALQHPTAGLFMRLVGGPLRLQPDGTMDWTSTGFGGSGAFQFEDERAARQLITGLRMVLDSGAYAPGSSLEAAVRLLGECSITRLPSTSEVPMVGSPVRPLTPAAAAVWAEVQLAAAKLRAAWAGKVAAWVAAQPISRSGNLTLLAWMAIRDGEDSPFPIALRRGPWQAQLLLDLSEGREVSWPEHLAPLFALAELSAGLRLRMA